MSSDGRITHWQERIVLASIPLDNALTVIVPQGPDLEIDVKRG
jgi:hypothetical protein